MLLVTARRATLPLGLTSASKSPSSCACTTVQICHEFTRFAEFMPNVKVGNYFGGLDIKKQRQELKDNTPAIVVGTPGRIKQVRWGLARCMRTVGRLACICTISFTTHAGSEHSVVANCNCWVLMHVPAPLCG